MGLALRVDVGALDASAGGLDGIATAVRSMGERLGMVGESSDPHVSSGLEQLARAYATVLALVGDDLESLGRKVAEAGVQYRLNEAAQAEAFT
jgi:hypothetical protein